MLELYLCPSYCDHLQIRFGDGVCGQTERVLEEDLIEDERRFYRECDVNFVPWTDPNEF